MSGRRGAGRAAPILLALAVLALLWWPTLRWPPARDQGVFAAVADVINDGGLLYRDAFDLKPPLVYHLYAAALSMHRSAEAIRVLDFLILSIGLVFAALLFPPRRRWALAPLLALALGGAHFFLHGHWNAALPDNWTAVPVVVALWARGRWRRSHAVGTDLFAGAMAGLAFWLKFTAGVYLVLFAVLALTDWRRDDRRIPHLVRRWAALAVGFALPAAAVVAHFAVRGGLRELWETEFVYVFHYAGYQPRLEGDLWIAGHNVSQLLRGVGIFFSWFPQFAVLPLVLLAVGVLRRRLLGGVIWLALAFAALSVAAQQKFFLNHLGALVLWLSVLSALSLETLARLLRAGLRRRARLRAAPVAWVLGMILLGVFTVGSSVFPDRWGTLRAWWHLRADDPLSQRAYHMRFGTHGVGDHSHLANLEVAQHLAATTAPDDTIFIWGFEPAVYFHADRRSPTRFLFIAPLVAPPAGLGWREELLSDLQANPPAAILILRGDDHWYLHGIRGDSQQTLVSTNPDLAAWIEERYEFERQMEDFTVLRRR